MDRFVTQSSIPKVNGGVEDESAHSFIALQNGVAPSTIATEDSNEQADLRADIPFHPLANIFPLMEGRQFNELVEDVRINGLNEPIVLHEGTVLDGRNRLRACIAAGVPYRTVPFQGTDPIAFVISANVHRRHLSTSQRSMLAAELANMRQGTRTDLAPNGAMSQGDAAKLLNVGRRSVQRAVALRENADSAVIEMVKRGQMTTAAATALTRLPLASGAKPGVKANVEIPAAADQPREDNDACVQAVSTKESPTAQGRTTARRPVIQAAPPDLFPNHQSGCAGEDARQHNKPSHWLPPTREQQFVERLRDLLNSDDWQQVDQEFQRLNLQNVIRAFKKGPMLRVRQ